MFVLASMWTVSLVWRPFASSFSLTLFQVDAANVFCTISHRDRKPVHKNPGCYLVGAINNNNNSPLQAYTGSPSYGLYEGYNEISLLSAFREIQ